MIRALRYKKGALPKRVRDLASQTGSFFVAALSFEERCLGALTALQSAGVRINSGLILDYPTQAHPIEEDRERRRIHRTRIEKTAETLFLNGVEFKSINPYSFKSFDAEVLRLLSTTSTPSLLFDLTCFTKLHTLALSSFLSRRATTITDWCCSYTSPENYANLDDVDQHSGWKDIIIAPLGENAKLLFESFSRGIVVTGHEAARLLVAISEVEPSGGLILVGNTPTRPDLRRLSERCNQAILRQLTRMRSRRWSHSTTDILSFQNVTALVRSEIASAKVKEAPVILFPFGPKPIIFGIGLLMAKEYPESSWVVYPIRSSYDARYTDGVGKTFWLVPDTDDGASR